MAPVPFGSRNMVLYYPTDSQLQIYDIYTTRRYFGLPTLKVNICIWSSPKSVDDGTPYGHGDGRRATSQVRVEAPNNRDRGRETDDPLSIFWVSSNVVHNQGLAGTSRSQSA